MNHLWYRVWWKKSRDSIIETSEVQGLVEAMLVQARKMREGAVESGMATIDVEKVKS